MIESVSSAAKGVVNGITDAVLSAGVWIKDFTISKIQNVAYFVSYENLNHMGADAVNYANASAPVRQFADFLDQSITYVGDNTPTSSNWLPISVVIGSLFASIKLTQAGVSNISLRNYKRAFGQFFVGASAAFLAASIVDQTPIGQAVRSKIMEKR